MGKEINNRLERITNTLLLNSSFITNIGLMHGKMGICIYFFHLANAVGNKTYKTYAEELLDEIFDETSEASPTDFENGLTGIGWGVEYIVQNGFIEADTGDVLEDLDKKLFGELIYNTPVEIGLLNGIIGLGAYFLKRIQNPNSNDDKVPCLTNKQNLIHIIDELERRTQDVKSIMKEICRVENKNSPVGTKKSSFPLSSNNGISEIFDLSWDYPVLIWFLSELYEQKLLNFKVEKIIKRLVAPLQDKKNWPKLHSNRLLLALVLVKLKNIEIDYLGIVDRLFTEVNRNTINKEAGNSVAIHNGTMGIAWIYQQLYQWTKNEELKIEMDYWLKKTFEMKEADIGNAGFDFENKDNAFGLSEGLAGIGLLYDVILQFDS